MSDRSDRPLDQQNRDWTKGNCYYAALEFMKDFPKLVEGGYLKAKTDAFLVHGTIGKEKVNHAWVEFSDKVFDNSNNQSICCPKAKYYEHNAAVALREFSRVEADAILQCIQGEDGSFDSMNWSQYTDDQVARCLNRYDPATSPFTNDVSFSDPTDSANRDGLNLK